MLSALLMAAAGGASAQGLSAARGLSREETLRLSPPMAVAQLSMGDEPCPARPVVANAKAALPFTSLDVTGTTVIPRAEALSIAAKPLGVSGAGPTMVTADALPNGAADLVCSYRKRGFVFAHAQVLTLGGGAYRIVITEGVLGRVEAAVDDPHLAAALLRAFSGLKPGRPIDAADVRRGLVTASAQGIAEVRPTVRRSRNDPNALDVILVAQPPRPVLGLQVQNLNSEALGRWGALGSLELNGLTPFYDRTDLGVFQSLEQAGQTTAQLSSHVLTPLWGSGLGADFAYSRAEPRGALKSLDITSHSYFGRLALDRFLLVRRGLLTHASTGLEAVDQTTDYLGGTPFIRDRIRVLFLKGQMDAVPSFGGVLNVTGEVRKGIDGLGASSKNFSLLSVAGADPAATVLRADASYSRTVGPLDLRGTVRGQYSDSTLTAFEQITFGNLNGGRGFDPAAIAGDRGVAMSLEAQGPAFAAPLHSSLIPFAFTDASRIEATATPANARWALSAGGGVRVRTANHVNLDLTYAAPVKAGTAPQGAYGPLVLFTLSTATADPLQQAIGLFSNLGGRK